MNTLPENIQNLIEKKNLELIEVMQRPNESRRRFFSLHVREQGGAGRNLVLKVFGRGDPTVVSGFEKEVRFLQKAAEEGLKPLGNHIPRLVDRGNGERPWCLKEYFACYIGDICLDFGIREGSLTSELREDFLEFFSALCEYSEEIRKTSAFSTLSVHGSDWYKKDFEFYKKHVRCLSNAVFKKAEELIESKEGLLDEQVLCLVHGDLYPKNIFWSPGLKVSDWELLHVGTPVFDPCFVWALAWQDPLWQESFLGSFREELSSSRPRSEGLLNVVQLVVLLRFIRHSEIMLGKVLAEDEKEAKRNAELALDAHRKKLENILSSC